MCVSSALCWSIMTQIVFVGNARIVAQKQGSMRQSDFKCPVCFHETLLKLEKIIITVRGYAHYHTYDGLDGK